MNAQINRQQDTLTPDQLLALLLLLLQAFTLFTLIVYEYIDNNNNMIPLKINPRQSEL